MPASTKGLRTEAYSVVADEDPDLTVVGVEEVIWKTVGRSKLEKGRARGTGQEALLKLTRG